MASRATVATGDAFEDWERFLTWDPEPALQRVQRHQPGPFELDVELQEDVFLTDWRIGDPEETVDNSTIYPIQHDGVVFDGRVSSGIEGKATRKALRDLAKKKQRPTLFGVLHYETCRLVLQPLTVFTEDGPAILRFPRNPSTARLCCRP